MGLKLDSHDKSLVDKAAASMLAALKVAHARGAVAKRIVALAVRERNRERTAAVRRYPFKGICEKSGWRLAADVAVLDELEPHLGYAGRVRWVCPKANNSGKKSCGGC